MPIRHRAALLLWLLWLPLPAFTGDLDPLIDQLKGLVGSKGRLEVSSTPGGVKVLVNGEWKGNTPTEPTRTLLLTLPVGPYRLEAVIEATGQRGVQEVYVAADSIQPVQLLLSAPVPATVNIPAGSFLMGSPDDEPVRDGNEGPQHRVEVPGFALGKYEVTFAQWDACVADGGCRREPSDYRWGRDDRPVIDVDWHDAQEYVNWLSRTTGETWRLPSEAEWEYAARAGTTRPFSTGACIDTTQANYDGRNEHKECGTTGFISDSNGVHLEQTQPVGSYPANPWGLHDMQGNVWEWTQDCWNDTYSSAPGDGRAWTSGDCRRRALRGGSWDSDRWSLAAARRVGKATNIRRNDLGFRVVRTHPP